MAGREVKRWRRIFHYPGAMRCHDELPLIPAFALALIVFGDARVFGQTVSMKVPGASGRNWIDTGHQLPPNTRVQVFARGSVNVGLPGSFGPGGTDRPTLPITSASTLMGDLYRHFPSPESRHIYGLALRVTASKSDPHDESRHDFDYAAMAFCAESGGHLWLTVNDDTPRDNIGSFEVQLTLSPCAAGPPSSPAPSSVLRPGSSMRMAVLEIVAGRLRDLALATATYPMGRR